MFGKCIVFLTVCYSLSIGIQASIKCYSAFPYPDYQPPVEEHCDSEFCSEVIVTENGTETLHMPICGDPICKQSGLFVRYEGILGNLDTTHYKVVVVCCVGNLCNSHPFVKNN